jgi:flavodoxin I
MYQVLYYSRGGNTRKLADVIAGELGVKAVDVKAATLEPGTGILFLGSGCYGGKAGGDMMKFIGSHDFSGRKVAVFSTSGGGMKKEIDEMSAALKNKGANILGTYTCKGKVFMIFSRGHPNQEDLDGGKKFAREMAKLG